jgi:hypothetical protein
VEIDSGVEECQKAFSTVCSFTGTRDLIQEHIAFRVWPLVESWEIPKETTTDSSEGGLVQLKYTFRFGDKFDEPNDDWLKCIEATSNELLGAYSKAEDNALSTAFGGRNKKRLNRVFDAISFVYPNYRYPLRGQEKKRKIAASVITAEPKGKKIKVLTHRPCYIEPAVIPEFGKGTSSAAEVKETVPIVQSTEEPTVVPKVTTVGPAEAEDNKAKESQVERVIEMPEILSPLAAIDLPKMHRAPAATPKRSRMANVLDAVMETTKALSPAPTKKIFETAKAQSEAKTGQAEAKAIKTQAEVEGEPLAPAATKTATPEERTVGQISPEKIETLAPEASIENVDYIIRHASGKKLTEEEILEARHYAQKLKYPKGALVFNDTNDDDFLYCLPDNKEISVCREICKSMGFPKLEDGLSILSKDDLADSLAYNNIKV